MGKKEKTSPEKSPTKVAKVVNLSVSIGDEDSARLLPEFVEAIRAALADTVKSVTVTGQHYIILKEGSGKVCREPDYDPDTRDFRPGATPPPWAAGSPESGRVVRQQSAAPGARDPENLRTVQETLAARAKSGTGKKLRVRPGSATGDLGATRTPPRPSAPAAPPVDLDAVEDEAEKSANDATSPLLLKLRGKSAKK